MLIIACLSWLQARAGHSEAARYLIAKGADVTAVDDNGDSALSVATTTSMVTLLKGRVSAISHAGSGYNFVTDNIIVHVFVLYRGLDRTDTG